MAAFVWSGYLDIDCLRTFGSILHLEDYRIPLSESFEPVPLDVGIMYEYIVSILPGQEPIALLFIKPFHCSFNHTPNLLY